MGKAYLKRVTYILGINAKPDAESIEIEFNYDVRKDPMHYLTVFWVKVFIRSVFCPMPIAFEYTIYGEQPKAHVNGISDFILPSTYRGIRVGGFILNKIFQLMPDEIKPFAYVSGRLTPGDASYARDRLYKKLIKFGEFGNCADAKFVESGPKEDGSFYGRFYDVGDSWKKSLTVMSEKHS